MLVKNKWRDVVVHDADMSNTHSLRDELQQMFEATLTPWNHAPRQLPEVDFKALTKRNVASPWSTARHYRRRAVGQTLDGLRSMRAY